MSRRGVPWLAIGCVLLMVFLYAPLVVAALYAFNSGSRLVWPPEGLSLRWFVTIFSDDLFQKAFMTSMVAALSSATIACVIGTVACLVFTRRTGRLTRLVEALGRLPVMLPPLFIGIGLVALMKATTFSPSMVTIVGGHIIVVIPFVILVVGARLRTYELEAEQAARDLGATPLQVIGRVTLPIIAPAVLGAFLVAAPGGPGGQRGGRDPADDPVDRVRRRTGRAQAPHRQRPVGCAHAPGSLTGEARSDGVR
jgi:putative spermidine/putrescine transport system permease protein